LALGNSYSSSDQPLTAAPKFTLFCLNLFALRRRTRRTEDVFGTDGSGFGGRRGTLGAESPYTLTQSTSEVLLRSFPEPLAAHLASDGSSEGELRQSLLCWCHFAEDSSREGCLGWGYPIARSKGGSSRQVADTTCREPPSTAHAGRSIATAGCSLIEWFRRALTAEQLLSRFWPQLRPQPPHNLAR